MPNMMAANHGAESHVRSALKAISYRTAGTLLTATISLVMTGSVKTAMLLGCAEVTTKVALYWVHERAWARVRWGRHPAPVAERDHAVTHTRTSVTARDPLAT
jgi:uncharacterized membrane protein